MELLTYRQMQRRGTAAKERGVVLLVTLVVLVVLTLAGVSAIRATDTTNLIAGNFAFKQSAMQASDRAITDAMNTLSTVVAGGNGNTDVSNRYFALRQTGLDSLGVPNAINWSNVACVDQAGAAVADCGDAGKYRIQYYLERQCDAAPTLTDNQDIKTKCDFELRSATPTEEIAIRYRVIIRVRGPRNATGIYEVMLSGPATS